MDKQSFIIGVKASIAEILERSTNKWVSVLEPGASFGAILAKNGISPKITPPLFDVLTANGLVERLGDKSAIRYRYQPHNSTTPDLDKLAEKVFAANQAYNRQKSVSGKQKRVTPPREVNQNGRAARFKGDLLPHIGDSRYVLMDCDTDEGIKISIVEVKIVAARREMATGHYWFEAVYRSTEDGETRCLEDLRISDLYVSAEAVAQRLIARQIKFRGPLFPTIKPETVKQNGR